MASGSFNFKLQDKNGKVFTLDSFKGFRKVVYFYPKDDTPGCTIEAKGFDSILPKFISTRTAVIGISGGTNKSKGNFCKKHSLKLPLLTDQTGKVAKAYGSFGKGILRNTYVLDEKNKIMKKFEGVTPKTHPAEVLKFVASNMPVVEEKKAAPVKAAGKKMFGKKATKKTSKKTVKKTAKKSSKKAASKKKAAPRKTAKKAAKKGAKKSGKKR